VASLAASNAPATLENGAPFFLALFVPVFFPAPLPAFVAICISFSQDEELHARKTSSIAHQPHGK
jgi:hypothetical protein